jgi:hypothetical protein
MQHVQVTRSGQNARFGARLRYLAHIRDEAVNLTYWGLAPDVAAPHASGNAGSGSRYAVRFSATSCRRSRICSVLAPTSSRRGSCERLSRPKTRSKSGVVR